MSRLERLQRGLADSGIERHHAIGPDPVGRAWLALAGTGTIAAAFLLFRQ